MESTLSVEKKKDIAYLANDIRRGIVTSLASAGSGHTAGPLGMADVFAVFYSSVYRHRPHDPFWKDRDMFVLSNGHICPVLYAAMAYTGYFPVEELEMLRTFKTRLQGHPHREYLPGVETSSGPLGSGMSQAVGMALADVLDSTNNNRFVYCFTSDGEHQCGQTWEAVLQAGDRKLSRIISVMDRNHIQINGRTEDVMGLEPFVSKYEAFNWHTHVVDGHNIQDIYTAFKHAQEETEKPSIIFAETVPSKGVVEFEGDYRWHGAPPGKGPEDKVAQEHQVETALSRIDEERKKIAHYV